MRVMVLIKANEQSERGEMPSEQLLTEMTAFNEELVKAGVMLAGEGLHPSAKGVRVAFKGSERKVIDGPFAETKELLAGFWVWQVRSLDEAVEKSVETGDRDTFTGALAALLDGVRDSAVPHEPGSLDTSDLILPHADATLEEVRDLLSGDGLIPG